MGRACRGKSEPAQDPSKELRVKKKGVVGLGTVTDPYSPQRRNTNNTPVALNFC